MINLDCEDAPAPAATVENAFGLSNLDKVDVVVLALALVVVVETIAIAIAITIAIAAARLRSDTTNLHPNRLGIQQ